MKHHEKAYAKRLSEYVDGLIVCLRTEESAHAGQDDSSGELAKLAADLSGLRLLTPSSAHEDVKRQVFQRLSHPEAPRESWSATLLSRCHWRPRAIYASATGLACTFGLLVAFYFLQPPQMLVATVLARSHAALTKLVGPGEVLHREWKITIQHQRANSPQVTVENRRAEEWLKNDGEMTTAKRLTGHDGNLLMAFSTGSTGQRHLQEAYFPPNPAEPRGLLSIEPSRDQLQVAISGLPPARQGVLLAWLDRVYTDPVQGEQQFNQTALWDRTEFPQLPRALVHLSNGTNPDGERFYRVSLDEPRRVGFLWTVEGAPCSWIEHRETVTYISAVSYLSSRTEEAHLTPNGDRLTVTRELIRNEVLPKTSSTPDVFDLAPAAGTPVRPQSAAELLSAVQSALDGRAAPASCGGEPRLLW